MRLKNFDNSDNDRIRSKQNCQVNCDFLKALKYRRRLRKLNSNNFYIPKENLVNIIKNDGNCLRKDTIADKVIER